MCVCEFAADGTCTQDAYRANQSCVLWDPKSDKVPSCTVVDCEHHLHQHTLPITCVHANADKLSDLERSINRFGELWVQLYGKLAVTPYVHLICAHAAQLVKLHGSLGDFSNSGLESFHKVVKWMLCKTSRWGGEGESHIALDLMRNYYKMVVLDIEHADETLLGERVTSRGWIDCACHMGGECRWEQKHLECKTCAPTASPMQV